MSDKLLNLVEEGEWRGLRQWRCTLCQFDSVASRDVVVRHIVARHLPPPPSPEQGTPLLTAAPGVEVVTRDEMMVGEPVAEAGKAVLDTDAAAPAENEDKPPQRKRRAPPDDGEDETKGDE